MGAFRIPCKEPKPSTSGAGHILSCVAEKHWPSFSVAGIPQGKSAFPASSGAQSDEMRETLEEGGCESHSSLRATALALLRLSLPPET